MSNIWILRFVPYEGGPPSDAVFREKVRAEAAFAASNDRDRRVTLTDDLGVVFCFDPSRGVVVLTNVQASAQGQKELTEANSQAGFTQSSTTGWGKA